MKRVQIIQIRKYLKRLNRPNRATISMKFPVDIRPRLCSSAASLKVIATVSEASLIHSAIDWLAVCGVAGGTSWRNSLIGKTIVLVTLCSMVALWGDSLVWGYWHGCLSCLHHPGQAVDLAHLPAHPGPGAARASTAGWGVCTDMGFAPQCTL